MLHAAAAAADTPAGGSDAAPAATAGIAAPAAAATAKGQHHTVRTPPLPTSPPYRIHTPLLLDHLQALHVLPDLLRVWLLINLLLAAGPAGTRSSSGTTKQLGSSSGMQPQ